MKSESQILEQRIALFLRGGVFVAGGLLILSWIFQPSDSGENLNSFLVYEKQNLLEVLNEVVSQGKWHIIVAYLGLFLLLILPIIRVFLTAILFFKNKEKIIATIAASVFILLIMSMFMGLTVG